MTSVVNRGPQTAFVEYQFIRPWKIIFPSVFRYLPTQYVDLFFETGEIRLSSFAKFAQHADEARGDREEGKSMVSLQGAGRQFGAFTIGGLQAYILCGSLIHSKAIMAQFSGCDAAIEIFNVPGFANEIARQLSGFMSGVSGQCIYADNRILIRHVEDISFSPPVDPKEKIPIESIFSITAAAGQEEDLLLKRSKYASQAEYRLIWNIDKPPQNNLVVTSLEARNFCRRVTAEEMLEGPT